MKTFIFIFLIFALSLACNEDTEEYWFLRIDNGFKYIIAGKETTEEQFVKRFPQYANNKKHVFTPETYNELSEADVNEIEDWTVYSIQHLKRIIIIE